MEAQHILNPSARFPPPQILGEMKSELVVRWIYKYITLEAQKKTITPMIDYSTHQTENGTLVIRLGGRLDAESTDYFFQCVQDELESGVERVVINCADLGYVSSVGLGMLVRARSRITAAGGKINLARIDSNVLKVIRLVNLDRLFNIFETERAAIEDMEKDFA